MQKKKRGLNLAWLIAVGSVCSFIVLGAYGLNILKGDEGENDLSANVVVIPSRTPAGAASETPIPLPTDTPIPLPTNTPDPVEAVRELADGVIIGDIEEVIVNMGALVVRYQMGQDFSGYNVGFAEDEMVHLACVLRDAGYAESNYQFHALVEFRDDFGNISLGDGLVARLMPDAIAAINCENYAIVNLQGIAQFYELAEGLR
jgi:hypothetical protein